MTDRLEQDTWDVIAALLAAGDTPELERYLDSLKPAETARAVARLDDQPREQLFQALSPREAAAVILDLPDAQAADVIGDLEPAQAAPIVEELPDDERADVLGDISESAASAILARMSSEEASEARQLMAYPDNVAGGLMTKDYLAFGEEWTTARVEADLRSHREQYANYHLLYLYVVNAAGALVGVLRLHDLLLAPAATRVGDLMLREPLAVPVDMALDNLRAVFHERSYLGLPVVDARKRLVGVVLRDSVFQAAGESDQHTMLKMGGILGGEELRSMPLTRRVAKRLSWLSLNVLLNLLAASVIAAYQETLSAAVVLAVFLPIISDMSGCSGNQAVAVSIRELSVGLVRPTELGRVLLQEITVGLANGAFLGALLSLLAWLWTGNPYLGVVAGVALGLNTILSVCLGGLLPLGLGLLKMDPALASGPILTTITDMCGFFLTLSSATLMLPQLAS